MTEIFFEIPGEPVAKGRAKVVWRKHLNRVIGITPDKTVRAESEVKLFASEAMAGRSPLEGALVLEVIAYRAKGLPKPGKTGPGKLLRDMLAARVVPTTKPDTDNYLKMVCDGCNGVIWLDDGQVSDKIARKRYSDRPRIEVRIRPYEPPLESSILGDDELEIPT